MLSSRYSDIVNNLDSFTFHILGCGAIGSSTATQLARMGAGNFRLYDFDKVELENVGVSQYYESNIGEYKVDALTKHIKDINPQADVQTFCSMFKEYAHEDKNDVAILAFDSMVHRLKAVEILCYQPKHKPMYIIDGRMGAEHYQQYTIKDPSLKKYLKFWYSDEEGDPEPCNAKATSYCSNMSGSFIVNTIRKLATGQPYHGEISFHFPTMLIDKGRMIA